MLLDVSRLKEALNVHQISMQEEAQNLTKELVLLQEVINLKTNVVISLEILRTYKESLFHYKK